MPKPVLDKVRKLAQLPEEARQNQFAVAVTRLTVLKSLCQEPAVAHRFVLYLVRKTFARVERGQGRSGHLGEEKNAAHRQMMTEALTGMEAWMQEPTAEGRQKLMELLGRLRAEQNEYKNIPWGAARLIDDWDLLLFEKALSCLIHPPREGGYWAYQMARDYAERYDSSHGTGLTPASAPFLQDIADFWMHEFGLDGNTLSTPTKAKTAKRSQFESIQPDAGPPARKLKAKFTHRQGQFLAFIHVYSLLHRQAPSELDLVMHFRVTPPSVHSMIVKLQELGLITRAPGKARSIRVVLPKEQIPELEAVKGPPW